MAEGQENIQEFLFGKGYVLHEEKNGIPLDYEIGINTLNEQIDGWEKTDEIENSVSIDKFLNLLFNQPLSGHNIEVFYRLGT